MSLLTHFFESQPLLALSLFCGLMLLTAISAVLSFYLLLRCIEKYCQWTHAERMQMIESGHSADLVKMLSQGIRRDRVLAVTMGFVVPCTAILGATAVTLHAGDSIANPLVAWICGLSASMTSTVCATIVATSRKHFPEKV